MNTPTGCGRPPRAHKVRSCDCCDSCADLPDLGKGRKIRKNRFSPVLPKLPGRRGAYRLRCVRPGTQVNSSNSLNSSAHSPNLAKVPKIPKISCPQAPRHPADPPPLVALAPDPIMRESEYSPAPPGPAVRFQKTSDSPPRLSGKPPALRSRRFPLRRPTYRHRLAPCLLTHSTAPTSRGRPGSPLSPAEGVTGTVMGVPGFPL